MVHKVSYRKAEKADAAILSMKLREADYSELQAVHGIDVNVKQVLENAIEVSKEAVSGVDESGSVVLMFGVSVFNEEKNIGCPWLLGSHDTPRYARQLVSDGKMFTKDWRGQFTGLLNFVDCRNETSIRWLKRIGFYIHEPIQMGVMGNMFHPFSMFKEIKDV